MTIINVFMRFLTRKGHPHSPRYPNRLENRAAAQVTMRQPVPGSRAVQELSTVCSVCDHLRSAVRSLDIIRGISYHPEVLSELGETYNTPQFTLEQPN